MDGKLHVIRATIMSVPGTRTIRMQVLIKPKWWQFWKKDKWVELR